jgi:ribosomal-protein-alanine N-acetyltransferase
MTLLMDVTRIESRDGERFSPDEVNVRWMIRKDMPSVLSISSETGDPWTEDEFVKTLKQRNCIGKVAEVHDSRHSHIAGFMVYALAKTNISLVHWGVADQYRRMGVGTALLDHMKGKLGKRRSVLLARVAETDLGSQILMRSVGMIANDTVFGLYHGESMSPREVSAYSFIYRLEWGDQESGDEESGDEESGGDSEDDNKDDNIA